MLTIKFIDEMNYSSYDGYSYMNNRNENSRLFSHIISYEDASPYSAEDPKRLMEYIDQHSDDFSKIKITGAFSIERHRRECCISELDDDIKLALIFLYRPPSENTIIEFYNLRMPSFEWLAANRDLTLCIEFKELFIDNEKCFFPLSPNPNMRFTYNDEVIKNVPEWAEARLKFNRHHAETSYNNMIHSKYFGRIFIAPEVPITFGELCEKMYEQLDRYDHGIYCVASFCDDYAADIPSGILCIENGTRLNSVIYGMIEKDGEGRFVQLDTAKYTSTTKKLDIFVRLFNQTKADRVTFIVCGEHLKDINLNYACNTNYGVMIDRTSRTVSIMERKAAAIRFYQAMERSDIPQLQPPEKILCK